jgi:hypothetical protein
MKRKDFYKLAQIYLRDRMRKYEFLPTRSKYASFWRKVDDETFQVIGPDHSMLVSQFDAKTGTVFQFLDPDFEKKFPDQIGFYHLPYLSKGGVGVNQQWWSAENEEDARKSLDEFFRIFETVGLPWLDSHKTIESIIPLVENHLNFEKAVLLDRIGRESEAEAYYWKAHTLYSNFENQGTLTEPALIERYKFVQERLKNGKEHKQ